MFKGRTLCIASMHEKERVLKPLFEKEVGVTCIVPENLNTDELGTFSGEVERKLTPLETAKQKCVLAMQLSNCDLAIASEGSFGPHPIYGFIPSDDELLFFYDKKNNLEIIARELSTQTNYAYDEFQNYDQAIDFASSVLFPSHGLIVKDKNNQVIEKGITNWEQLKSAFSKAQQIYQHKEVQSKLDNANKLYAPILAKKQEQERLAKIERDRVEREDTNRKEREMPTTILQYLINESVVSSQAEIQDFKMSTISYCFSVSIVRVSDVNRYGNRYYADYSVDISFGNPCYYEYSSERLSEWDLEIKSNFLKLNYDYFLKNQDTEKEKEQQIKTVDKYYQLYKNRTSVVCGCSF